MRSIANLPKLHAVVFGKAVRSERPIIIQIPFDPDKERPYREADDAEKA